MTNKTGVNEMNEIEINGVKYIKADSKPNGTRAIIVVDRGWIFAGDITRKDGFIFLFPQGMLE